MAQPLFQQLADIPLPQGSGNTNDARKAHYQSAALRGHLLLMKERCPVSEKVFLSFPEIFSRKSAKHC
jgi:hypothetical protein